tara:strand:+ start:62 stop:535 length:474 start_codon:yes stop_codon:yes gene_type:complete
MKNFFDRQVQLSILVTAVATNLFWILIAANNPINYQPEQNLTTKAVIKEVYDGDTVVVTIQKDFRVRMLDCWAPEIKTRNTEEKKRGQKSKEFLKSLLHVDDTVIVKIPMTDRIQDSFTFGRVLAYLWKDVDGDGKLDDVSDVMIQKGFATKTKKGK